MTARTIEYATGASGIEPETVYQETVGLRKKSVGIYNRRTEE